MVPIACPILPISMSPSSPNHRPSISGLKNNSKLGFWIHLRFLFSVANDFGFGASHHTIAQHGAPKTKVAPFFVSEPFPPKWGFSHSTGSLLLVATGIEFASTTIKHIEVMTRWDIFETSDGPCRFSGCLRVFLGRLEEHQGKLTGTEPIPQAILVTQGWRLPSAPETRAFCYSLYDYLCCLQSLIVSFSGDVFEIGEAKTALNIMSTNQAVASSMFFLYGHV